MHPELRAAVEKARRAFPQSVLAKTMAAAERTTTEDHRDPRADVPPVDSADECEIEGDPQAGTNERQRKRLYSVPAELITLSYFSDLTPQLLNHG